MKFSIAASALEFTPPGLGELIYFESTNPLQGLMIKQIAAKADSVMTMWKNHPAGEYINFDTTICKILQAFSGEMDTISWSSTLSVKGVRSVGEVSFLRFNSSIPPVIGLENNRNIDKEEIPSEFAVEQNYPNPFNPTTTISFHLPGTAQVVISIYDALGREVDRIINAEEFESGEQSVVYSATGLSSGVYFYRVRATMTDSEDASSPGQTYMAIKKMVIIK